MVQVAATVQMASPRLPRLPRASGARIAPASTRGAANRARPAEELGLKLRNACVMARRPLGSVLEEVARLKPARSLFTMDEREISLRLDRLIRLYGEAVDKRLAEIADESAREAAR